MPRVTLNDEIQLRRRAVDLAKRFEQCFRDLAQLQHDAPELAARFTALLEQLPPPKDN